MRLFLTSIVLLSVIVPKTLSQPQSPDSLAQPSDQLGNDIASNPQSQDPVGNDIASNPLFHPSVKKGCQCTKKCGPFLPNSNGKKTRKCKKSCKCPSKSSNRKSNKLFKRDNYPGLYDNHESYGKTDKELHKIDDHHNDFENDYSEYVYHFYEHK